MLSVGTRVKAQDMPPEDEHLPAMRGCAVEGSWWWTHIRLRSKPSLSLCLKHHDVSKRRVLFARSTGSRGLRAWPIAQCSAYASKHNCQLGAPDLITINYYTGVTKP